MGRGMSSQVKSVSLVLQLHRGRVEQAGLAE